MRPIALIALLAVACDDTPADGTDTDAVQATDETDDDAPDPNVVRACIAEAWLRQTCTGCHFGGNYLDLRNDALEQLATKSRELDPNTPIVAPNDPDNSILVRKLEARVGLVTLEEGEGDPMPPDTMITEANAELIRDWVANGAVLPEGC